MLRYRKYPIRMGIRVWLHDGRFFRGYVAGSGSHAMAIMVRPRKTHATQSIELVLWSEMRCIAYGA